MDWKITSKLVDTYEISPTDTQNEYIVYVKDAAGSNIDGALAYGITDRTKVTKEFISKYGNKIDKIEHGE
jgi:hypothetical protein|tara:strand:- start:282 stop:491 length:210 start_codon:yes stop_codon:yes gene_type:complete